MIKAFVDTTSETKWEHTQHVRAFTGCSTFCKGLECGRIIEPSNNKIRCKFVIQWATSGGRVHPGCISLIRPMSYCVKGVE